jgi:hypothetical protein
MINMIELYRLELLKQYHVSCVRFSLQKSAKLKIELEKLNDDEISDRKYLIQLIDENISDRA